MRILYITTAQSKESFNRFSALWKTPLNTSNQVFHNKMIRSLSLSNKIDVLSLRSLNKDCSKSSLKGFREDSENISWFASITHKNKIFKYISFRSCIRKMYQKEEYNFIFVDALNETAIRLALKARQKIHSPIIGVITDDPRNISYVSDSYKDRMIKLGKMLDGYVALTPKLHEIYSDGSKPLAIVEGLVEEHENSEEPPYKNYIFYGGVLMERYGILDLINSFKKVGNNGVSLVFCGHHAEGDKINKAIEGSSNIHYLGVLDNESVLALEDHSICNINPRAVTNLDEYSVPSKTLEYLNSKSLTVSYKNHLIYSHFSKDIIWAEEGKLDEAIKAAINMSKEDRKSMVAAANKNVSSKFGLSVINKKLDVLLSSFSK